MAAAERITLEELEKLIAAAAEKIAKRDLARVRRKVRKQQRELHDPDCPFAEEE